MIVEQKIKIRITNRNITHFKNLGYDVTHNQYTLIDVDHITIGSKIKIKVSCDLCNIIKEINYCNYIDNIKNYNFYSCKKCSVVKNKMTMLERYGVENISQTDNFKEKVKNTWKLKTKEELLEINDKTKLTNLSRYGNESYKNLDKAKQTNLEKYGVENVFQNDFIKLKIKKTNLEKYGVDYPLQNNEIQNKQKNTNLEKYGAEYIMQNNQFLNKRIDTYIKNYGVDNPMKNYKIRKKSKNTCLEKYGVESPMQSDILFNKQQKSGLKTKTHQPSNLKYQGTYELNFLERYYNKVIIEKINPIQYQLNENTHYYHPDFYLPKYNLIVEVKSSYTYEYDLDKNLAKKEYSIKSGFNFIFIIDKNYSELESILLESSPDNQIISIC
jgi:hypothetical protein